MILDGAQLLQNWGSAWVSLQVICSYLFKQARWSWLLLVSLTSTFPAAKPTSFPNPNPQGFGWGSWGIINGLQHKNHQKPIKNRHRQRQGGKLSSSVLIFLYLRDIEMKWIWMEFKLLQNQTQCTVLRSKNRTRMEQASWSKMKSYSSKSSIKLQSKDGAEGRDCVGSRSPLYSFS